MQTSDSESERKDYAHEDIHAVDSHVGSHRTDTVLHSYEPALEGHETEGCRGSPYADIEVFRCKSLHFRTGINNQESRLDKYPLDRDQNQSACEGYAHGARQNACAFLAVATAVCLGRQAACADTEESEVPI